MSKPRDDIDNDSARGGGAFIDVVMDVVRRALADGGGTVVAAPAARSIGEVVDGRGGRATVVVYGGDAYFLRSRLTSSPHEHRTGWFRVALPNVNLRRR